MTTTTKLNDAEDLERFEYNGAIGLGAFVIDADGGRWLAFDSENGAMCVRPSYANEPDIIGRADGRSVIMPVSGPLGDRTFPLTIITVGED